MGYNDQILRGVQETKEGKDFMLLFSAPADLTEAERIFSDWLELDTENIECLFVLAGNEYEAMARKYLSDGKYSDKEVLLFETSADDIPAYTFSISMYGACYLAGCAALPFTRNGAAVLCGNRNDVTVNRAAEGFVRGFTDNGGQQAGTFYLADDWTGYSMPDSAYRAAAKLAEEYDYLFPVAGGSNLGIYRYAREYPDRFFTAGMDVDQSGYSARITCSVVKHIDRLIGDYLNRWLTGQPLPRQAAYGLESGYIETVVSPGYEDTLQTLVSSFLERAIAAEKNEINH